MHVTHDLAAPAADPISFDHFLKVDIRVGTVTSAELFAQARKRALKLLIDFGPAIGTKRSSAQITEYYAPDVLAGRQVAAVVNLPPRQIGKFISEVLTWGSPTSTARSYSSRPTIAYPTAGDCSEFAATAEPARRPSGS